jgi:hypothetical protein
LPVRRPGGGGAVGDFPIVFGYASSVRHLDGRDRRRDSCFNSQGIALILIVAVLSLVVGGAALWIEMR